MADPAETELPAPVAVPDEHPYFAWARSMLDPGNLQGVADPAAAAQGAPIEPAELVTSPAMVPDGAPLFAPAARGATMPVPPVFAADQAPQPSGPIVAPSQIGAQQPTGDAVERERTIQSLTSGDQSAIAALKPEQVNAAVNGMTPDEFVRFKSLRDRQLVMRQAELEHNAAAESEQRAREDLQMQRDAVNKANADTAVMLANAQKLAADKEDPDRFVKHLGLGGSIAMLGAATLGGFASQYTGGRNLALENFDKRVNADIDAQRQDKQNAWKGIELRRGAANDTFNRSQDLYHAQETYRVAAYNAAIGKMQSELQQYDPAGGTAVFLRQNLDQFHAAQAAAVQAYNDHQLTNNLKVMVEDREQRLASSTIAKNLAETSKLYVEAANAKADNQLMSPAQIAGENPGAPPAAIPPVPMKRKDVKQHFETFNAGVEGTKKGQESSLGQREYLIGDTRAVRDADGNIVDMKSAPLTNKDGAPFLAPSMKEADQLRSQKAGIDTVSGFIDQMIEGIKKYGGSTAFFRSPEWTTMQANKESLLFGFHQAYGVEGFRPGVLEQMEKALGGVDPTSFTMFGARGDAVPGLEAAKRAVITHFNSNLRSAQYTGPEYSPESQRDGTPLPTFSDRTLIEEGGPGLIDTTIAGAKEDARALLHPFEDNPEPDTEGGGLAAGPTGLSPKDTNKAQDLIARYKKGTPATKEKVTAALTAVLGAGRPSFNTGLLGLVDGEIPELYAKLLEALPPNERDAAIANKAALDAIAAQRGGK